MRLWLLGSGSNGNALVLESGDTRVLVDAGFPARTLKRRMTACGIAPESITGAIITHEHTDHACGIALSAERWGWKVLASRGTIVSCPELAGAIPFTAGETVTLGAIDLYTMRTSHDATEPVAIVATSRQTGARIGVAYDMGMATDAVRRAMMGVDVLVLESNYDEAMLRLGPYPAMLKRRVASRFGHLSNRAAATYAREWAHKGLREIVLAHLSETNNDPELATRTMTEALARTAFRGRIGTAPQGAVYGPIAPSGAGKKTQQLSLF